MLTEPYLYILIFYELSMQFYRFVPVLNEGKYAWLVPFLVLLMQPVSNGADHIIILLKLSFMDGIYQGSEELNIWRC